MFNKTIRSNEDIGSEIGVYISFLTDFFLCMEHYFPEHRDIFSEQMNFLSKKLEEWFSYAIEKIREYTYFNYAEIGKSLMDRKKEEETACVTEEVNDSLNDSLCTLSKFTCEEVERMGEETFLKKYSPDYIPMEKLKHEQVRKLKLRVWTMMKPCFCYFLV